jgi:hypothetical protein
MNVRDLSLMRVTRFCLAIAFSMSVALWATGCADDTTDVNGGAPVGAVDQDGDGAVAGADCDDLNALVGPCGYGDACSASTQCSGQLQCLGGSCACADERFMGEACDMCAPKYTGPNCDMCANPKFMGSNCDECADAAYRGVNCDECAPIESYMGCSENAAFWFNDCGEPVSMVEECAAGTSCANGACISNDCQPEVLESYEACLEGTVYWFDDCGQVGSAVEVCADVASCVNGACVEQCQPQAGQYCFNNAITWYDSCDQPGAVVQACGANSTCEGCSIADKPCVAEPVCSEVNIDTDPTGSWVLVADIPYMAPCDAGSKTFEQQTLDLTVNGTAATAILEPPELFITLDFEGTMNGAYLAMTAAYVEAGPPSIGWASEHTHTLEAQLTSATTFDGTYIWEVVPNAANPCTYIWDITGTKQ